MNFVWPLLALMAVMLLAWAAQELWDYSREVKKRREGRKP